jgi:predicted LPLAT superfamily acyltransferase
MEIVAGDTPKKQRIQRLKILRFEAEGDHARELFASMPEDWKPELIAINRSEGFSTLSVLRALREGAIVAMHGDRLVDERAASVPFFGAKADFPTGPYLLAFLAKVPILEVYCIKEGRDGVRVRVLAPISVVLNRKSSREEQLAEYAAGYAGRLEEEVRREWGQWYNFHPFWDRGGAENAEGAEGKRESQ